MLEHAERVLDGTGTCRGGTGIAMRHAERIMQILVGQSCEGPGSTVVPICPQGPSVPKGCLSVPMVSVSVLKVPCVCPCGLSVCLSPRSLCVCLHGTSSWSVCPQGFSAPKVCLSVPVSVPTPPLHVPRPSQHPTHPPPRCHRGAGPVAVTVTCPQPASRRSSRSRSSSSRLSTTETSRPTREWGGAGWGGAGPGGAGPGRATLTCCLQEDLRPGAHLV